MTPATFIAMPCTPVGRPKRNSERMIVQSGRQSEWRESLITSRPLNNWYSAYALTALDAITVPSAEPAVPRAGIGPTPRISATLRIRFNTVMVTPSRSGVRASPAARNAEVSMKNNSMPMLIEKLMRRNGSASALTSPDAFTRSSRVGARK